MQKSTPGRVAAPGGGPFADLVAGEVTDIAVPATGRDVSLDHSKDAHDAGGEQATLEFIGFRRKCDCEPLFGFGHWYVPFAGGQAGSLFRHVAGKARRCAGTALRS